MNPVTQRLKEARKLLRGITREINNAWPDYPERPGAAMELEFNLEELLLDVDKVVVEGAAFDAWLREQRRGLPSQARESQECFVSPYCGRCLDGPFLPELSDLEAAAILSEPPPG